MKTICFICFCEFSHCTVHTGLEVYKWMRTKNHKTIKTFSTNSDSEIGVTMFYTSFNDMVTIFHIAL